jgi:hypothetical protein
MIDPPAYSIGSESELPVRTNEKQCLRMFVRDAIGLKHLIRFDSDQPWIAAHQRVRDEVGLQRQAQVGRQVRHFLRDFVNLLLTQCFYGEGQADGRSSRLVRLRTSRFSVMRAYGCISHLQQNCGGAPFNNMFVDRPAVVQAGILNETSVTALT